MQHFYVDLPLQLNKRIRLPEPILKQCLKVLRYESGERLRLFNGEVMMEGLLLQENEWFFWPETVVENKSEMKIKVRIIQALIRKERYEWFLQKATECGVHEIVPLYSQRCVVKWDTKEEQSKTVRHQKILQEASEQAERLIVPELKSLIRLKDIVDYRSELNLFCYEREESQHLINSLKDVSSITVVIGPEGGFNEQETAFMLENGFVSVSLGKRILRAETAGITALAQIDAYSEMRDYEKTR